MWIILHRPGTARLLIETDFPDLLETRRLEVRPYTNADAPMLLQLIDDNRELLQRNFGPLTKGVTQLTGAAGYVTESLENWKARKEYIYGVWCRPSEELVGQIKVKNIAWDIPASELSYFISQSVQRQGFATEAIAAMLAAAFEKLRFERIFLRIIASNVGSLGLAEKLGFKLEGLHRSAFRCGFGELHDVYHYAILVGDPDPRLS